jgi:formylglycine-generating enzyme
MKLIALLNITITFYGASGSWENDGYSGIAVVNLPSSENVSRKGSNSASNERLARPSCLPKSSAFASLRLCVRLFPNHSEVGVKRMADFRLVMFLIAAVTTCVCSAQEIAQEVAAAGPAPTGKGITNSIGMTLVLIPAGEFMMGSGESVEKILATFPNYDRKPEFFNDEFPQHRVRITRPFYCGVHEVTNAEFRQFVDATGYKTQAEREEVHPLGSGGWGFNQTEQRFEGRNMKYNWRNPGFEIRDDGPVVNVTWNDAVAFCRWLSNKEGRTYRLPTEAEWEYAARGGTKTRYWAGDDPNSLARIANTADAAFFHAYPRYYPREKTLSANDGQVFPAPVGSYPANLFGLCDVHGNVWEWTNDWWAEDYYAHSPVDDPPGPVAGDKKVRRGGAWHSAPLFARISFRNYNKVESRYPNLGFRIVGNVD